MATIQEKLDLIKAKEEYIENSLIQRQANKKNCVYEYLSCCGRKKQVFYSFNWNKELELEEQVVTFECCLIEKVADIEEGALKVKPIDKIKVKWTTEVDFNKGTHNDTQTISDGDGAICLIEADVPAYAMWHLNETTGTNVPDTSGNGRNGTTINMENEDWVAGKLNNCLQFDGVNEYVNCGDIANFEKHNSFTLECWFKTSSISLQAIITRLDATLNRGWQSYINGGSIGFMLINSATNQVSVVTVGNTFADGIWHNLIITYDGSSSASGIHIYIDGNDKPLTTYLNNLTATIQTNKNCEVAGRDGGSNSFYGTIDETIIYEVELTQEQVTARWNEGDGIEWKSHRLSGTYTSNSYDSQYLNQDWARIFYTQNLPENTTAEYKVRTSTDGESWGDWSTALTNGEEIIIDGRFIQWKADLTTLGNGTPKLFNLEITYQAQNIEEKSP